MPDLTREEIEVWIGGYRVPIDTFAAVTPADAERGGRSIVLILDDVTPAPAMVPRVRDAARRFVERMSPGRQDLDRDPQRHVDSRARAIERGSCSASAPTT